MLSVLVFHKLIGFDFNFAYSVNLASTAILKSLPKIIKSVIDALPFPSWGFVGYSKHKTGLSEKISILLNNSLILESVCFQNWTNGTLDVLIELILVPENWSRIVS